jgi:hypothetical protein
MVPWIKYEQIDVVGATGLLKSDGSRFRNNTGADVIVKYLLVDSVSVTDVKVRFGKKGRAAQSDVFVSTKAIHNLVAYMNQATDGAWPLLKLDYPCRIEPRQNFLVELQDTVNSADRIVDIAIYGYLEKDGEPYVITERVTVPQNGSISQNLQSDQDSAMIIDSVGLWIEETGTAANQRGMLMKLRGGGMPDWMDQRVPSTIWSPHRNAGAMIKHFETPLILAPGEAFEAEFFTIGGVDRTLHMGLVGYAADRRS